MHNGRYTFPNDLAKGIVAYDSYLLRRQLLAKLVISVRELSFAILGHGTRLFVPVCRRHELEIMKKERRRYKDQ